MYGAAVLSGETTFQCVFPFLLYIKVNRPKRLRFALDMNEKNEEEKKGRIKELRV